MKYLLIVDFQPGVADTTMEEWRPEEIEAHLDYYRPPAAGARRERRARRFRGPRRARPGEGRDLRWPDCAGRDRRAVPGVQGMGRRLSDRRRRLRGPSHRDRRRGSRRCPGRTASRSSSRSRCARSWTTRLRRRWRWAATSGPLRGEWAEPPSSVEDLLRELAPQVLGALTRRSGDFDAAEDAIQEALIAAADHWPRDGVPENPRGWLLRTAEPAADRPAAERSRSDGAGAADAAPGRRRAREIADQDDTLPCCSCAAIRRSRRRRRSP